jgi:Nucleoside-diphosphate-sugar pyrophosphorylase involved in lipopolysaccharide biosynthesis/translation initiation factor 2B, gamma/epsilon subunits (eIF-2Bgamma/eIF-2Bepsilon)
MKAILLAAGLGTRLQPLTDSMPKCLVKVKNKPLIQNWVEKLSDAGVNEFIVNTHYLHEQVEAFVKEELKSFKIKLIHEETLHRNCRNFIQQFELLRFLRWDANTR